MTWLISLLLRIFGCFFVTVTAIGLVSPRPPSTFHILVGACLGFGPYFWGRSINQNRMARNVVRFQDRVDRYDGRRH